MSYWRGIPYMVLWFSSILAGYAAFFCPLLPFMLVSNKFYRWATDFLMAFWQMYPSALLEFIYGCKITITGDAIDSNESCLLVMNHRTRTDWNFLWPAVCRATKGSNRWFYPTKFILKDAIRHLPGVGWAMQLGSYIFIKRNWQEDKGKLSRPINYFADLGRSFNILIFPEGTDFTPDNVRNSDLYAAQHNLPKYENVLHPRTTGFVYLARQMLDRRVLDAIYDVTIIYDDLVPQNESSLLRGRMPKSVRLHFKRFPVNSLPGGGEQELRDFLESIWEQKESTIRDYRAGFKGLNLGREIRLRESRRDLFLAVIFWSLLPFPVLHLFVKSVAFRYVVIAHTVFLLFVNLVTDGFQSVEIGLHEWKMKLGISRL